MDNFGHAIGLPSRGEPGRPPASSPQPAPEPESGNATPYGPSDAQPAAPADLDLVGAQAQARARAEGGDLTGARTMIEETLAAGELRLGRDNPALVPLMVDLASLARRLGNLTEAGNQLRRAYGIAIATDGPHHPTALAIEGRLAAVLYRMGESTEAYDWHLADAGRRVLGEDHPAVRGAQQRLAAVAAAATPAGPPPTPPPPAPPPPVAQQPTAPPVAPPPIAPPVAPASQPPVAPPPTAPPVAPPPPAPASRAPQPTASPPTPPALGTSPVPTVPVGAAAPDPAFVAPAAAPPARWTAPQPPVPYAPPQAGLPVVASGGPALEGDIWDSEEATVRTRRPSSGGVVLVASLCAVILVVGVVVALALLRPTPGPQTAPDPNSQSDAATASAEASPTASAPPAPDGLRIVEDAGGAVTLAWTDPSDGEVPFVVSGGRQGDALMAIVTVPAGQTTTTIYGLNVNFNYCFTVTAVWSSDLLPESTRTCTARANVSPSPA